NMTLRLNLIYACIAALICAGAGSGVARAQVSGHVLRGRVVDQMHAAIAHARINVTPPPANGQSLSSTDQNGEFFIPIEPGRYVLEVGADGFSAVSLAITATSGVTDLPDIALRVAGFTDQVEVTAPERSDGIISGAKTPTPLRDVPQSVTVI